MSPGARIAILAAVILVAAGGFVLANGSDDDNGDKTTTTAASSTPSDTTSTGTETTATETEAKPAGPPVHRVVVEGGKPKGGVQKIDVDKGDTVILSVKSDVADEIHIHGYDLMKDVEAGGTVRFKFKADIDGGYEIELEDAGEQIAELTVQP